MRKFLIAATILVAFAAAAQAKIYFSETFDNDLDGWVVSNWKQNEGSAGKFEVSPGKFYNDVEADKGLRTTEDYRFYTISKAFPADFTNKGKNLIFQFSVKHEQNIDCGGGYLKILPAGLDQSNFNGDSKYNIMFGPDICGSTKRIHVIFEKNGQNHLIKKTIPAESDEYTHLYTLIVRPDNTYEVRVDNKEVAKGSLEDDWDILPPKEILDPEAKKPSDWVDAKEIVDPEDKKPEGWDDTPKEIVDPDAKKPEDWDDELDGEWEAPLIPNPEYKGEWKPKMIPNPEYKGEWVHPKVPNPDYKPNPELYVYDSNAFVGLEVWQVKAGSIFDNILVTDSIEEAEVWAKKAEETKKGEKVMHDKQKEEQRQKDEEERKKREAEEAAKKEADGAEETEEDQKDEL